MAKDEFELLILLFLFLTCWDYLRAPSSLAYVLLEIESRALSMLESTLLSYILSPRHLLKIPPSSIFFITFYLFLMCACVCPHMYSHMSHIHVCMEIRGQLVDCGLSFYHLGSGD